MGHECRILVGGFVFATVFFWEMLWVARADALLTCRGGLLEATQEDDKAGFRSEQAM